MGFINRLLRLQGLTDVDLYLISQEGSRTERRWKESNGQAVDVGFARGRPRRNDTTTSSLGSFQSTPALAPTRKIISKDEMRS